jgi:hypothetical protein
VLRRVHASLLLLVLGMPLSALAQPKRHTPSRQRFASLLKVASDDFESHHARPLQLAGKPAGVRYFVTAPGPCSCGVTRASPACTADLDKALAKALADEKAPPGTGIECPPNAGCTPGFATLVVECPGYKGPEPQLRVGLFEPSRP